MESTDQVKVRLLCLIEGKYTNSPVYRLIVPPTHRYQPMLMIHGPNHLGVQWTTEEIRQCFYWPGWRKEVSIFVSDFVGCLRREVIDLKDTIPHKNRALRVNQTLCMDLVGSLTLSNNKNKYILTIFDHFSSFVVTVPKSAKTVWSSIYMRWIALFGSPDSIRTDAGAEFANNLLSYMMLKTGLRIKMSAPYNHQSNWEKSIQAIELAYNSSIHVTTGCSPVFFGVERWYCPTYPHYLSLTTRSNILNLVD